MQVTITDLDAAAPRLPSVGIADAAATPISSGCALMLADPDGNRVVFVGV